jgi:hypothetical protein
MRRSRGGTDVRKVYQQLGSRLTRPIFRHDGRPDGRCGNHRCSRTGYLPAMRRDETANRIRPTSASVGIMLASNRVCVGGRRSGRIRVKSVVRALRLRPVVFAAHSFVSVGVLCASTSPMRVRPLEIRWLTAAVNFLKRSPAPRLSIARVQKLDVREQSLLHHAVSHFSLRGFYAAIPCNLPQGDLKTAQNCALPCLRYAGFPAEFARDRP